MNGRVFCTAIISSYFRYSFFMYLKQDPPATQGKLAEGVAGRKEVKKYV